MGIIAVSLGYFSALPVVAISGVALVHGHVSFALPVPVFSLVAMAAGVYSRREALQERRPILIAGMIVLAGLLPIAIHTAIDFPGEFGRYFNYAEQRPVKHDLSVILRFVAHYWTDNLALTVSAFAALLIAASGRDYRPIVTRAALVALGSIAFMFIYAKWMMAFLDDYIGMFLISVPILLLGIGVAATAKRLSLPSWPLVIALTISLVILFRPGPHLAGSLLPFFHVTDPVQVRQVNDDLAAFSQGRPLRIIIPQRIDWSARWGDYVTQILLDQERRGIVKSCVDGSVWWFSLSLSRRCDRSSLNLSDLVPVVISDDGDPDLAISRPLGKSRFYRSRPDASPR